jgi:hypothetical protein
MAAILSRKIAGLRASRVFFCAMDWHRPAAKRGNFMKTVSIALALLALSAAAADAADYAVIHLEKAVARPPAAVWAKIGPYCAIEQWLGTKCVITSGSGEDVGTVRRLRDSIDEVMTGKTKYSYSYTQPTTTILYHGTLDVEPADGGKSSNIVYTLFYDAAPLGTPQAKAADRASRTKRFSAALDKMKAMAETP